MYQWINNYIGIPFVSGGRDLNGLDCYGLVRLILKNEYGYELPFLSGDYTNALLVSQTKRLFSDLAPILCVEKIAEPEESSVALIKSHGYLCHVALYAGDGFIINAKYMVGVVCERIGSASMSGQIEGFYRVSEDYRLSQSIYK